MPACPHCAKDLGSGFLDEETHRARLAAKDERVKALDADLKAARVKADAHDALSAELAKEKTARTAAEQRAGRQVELARAGITTEATAKRFDAVYEIYRAETGEGALEYAAWLSGPAREDALLSPLFASLGSGAKAAPGAPPPPKPNPLPNANAGAKDAAPPPGRLTEAQAAQAYQKHAEELRRTEPDAKKRAAALEQKKAELSAQMAPKAA
jgi:hypothetical protein